MITIETCPVCQGSGTLDYFEEYRWGTWVRRVKDQTPLDLLEAMAENFPDILRVRSGECGGCNGSGTYQCEHVRCKIF